jgi:hypothetical protein
MSKILVILSVSVLAIGLIFGRYLGRWLMNKADNPDTSINDGKKYADLYISNCDTLHLTLKNFKYKTRTFEVKAKANYLSDGNFASVDQHDVIFKDEQRQKYFAIYYFFAANAYRSIAYEGFIRSNLHQNGEPIVATVNKTELNDSSYGTITKPIPIIYFDTPGATDSFYSLVADATDDKDMFHGNEQQFKKYIAGYNAWHYLSYVKSKPDFDRMYKSGKAL